VSLILVADDEPHIVKLVEFTLAKRGFDVVTARDGEEAVRVAGECRPDLILLDVMMPVMNGFDALRALKRDPHTSRIPVVILSAKSQQTEVAEGIELGAVEYIRKPFTPSGLAERVSAVLDAYEEEAE